LKIYEPLSTKAINPRKNKQLGKSFQNNWRFLLLLTAGLLLLAACSGPGTKRLWLKAPGWSRAEVVGGMGIPDPAPMVIDEQGHIYFLFINGESEALQAQVLAFDSQGERLWNYTFNDILKLPDDPRLTWDGRLLHAFWISNGKLFTAALETNGQVFQEPVDISAEIRVDSYSVAGSPQDELVVWFATDRTESDLYWADLSLENQPTLLDEEGVLPSIGYDAQGTLHALWAHYPRGASRTRFLYATYSEGQYQPNNGSVIYETRIPETAVMIGPTIGLDTGTVYLHWIRLFRTGLEAGSTETRVLSFPFSDPAGISEPRSFSIPPEHDLVYEDFPAEDFKAGPRYPLAPEQFGLTVLQDINPNPVQEEELVIAFRAPIEYFYRRSASQIGLVYLQDGAPTSYQLLSFTQAASADPLIISDSEGHLYVSWLESGDISRYDVYFAGTSPGMHEAFNSITADDITQLTAATVFGLLTGILLAPIAAVLWLVLPALVIGITSFIRRGEQTLRSPGTIITLTLAVISFQVAKLASLPAIRDYVPFSAWLPLPTLLKVPLQILVPLAIMITGLIVAWHFTYRQKSDSPLYFIMLFVGVDTLLTMAVYGVLFYGAF
jgi:hypothetical protein